MQKHNKFYLVIFACFLSFLFVSCDIVRAYDLFNATGTNSQSSASDTSSTTSSSTGGNSGSQGTGGGSGQSNPVSGGSGAGSTTTSPLALPGLFTINSKGDKVQFSRGNLYHTGTSGKSGWDFEKNQYDFRMWGGVQGMVE